MSGSVFVTQAFRDKIEGTPLIHSRWTSANQLRPLDKLGSSRFGSEEYIDRAVEEFDKKTKCLFRDKANTAVIRLGSRKDNDPPHGIKMGQISLPGCVLLEESSRSSSITQSAGISSPLRSRNLARVPRKLFEFNFQRSKRPKQ